MERVPIPKGSLISAKAMIISDKIIASSKALEVTSMGSAEPIASKNPEPKQQGGISKRKKTVPRIKSGFIKLITSMKKAQKKVDRKSSITILPREGIIWRETEKTRAVSPYTQIRAAAQTMAKANLLDANKMRKDPVRAERGECEPQKR